MNWRKTLSVLRKEWWHIVRDRRTALLVTLSPVVFLIVLAYSFSIEIKQVSLAVMDQDKTPLSRQYLARLTDSGDLVTCCAASNYAEIERWLVDGRVKGAVIIPPNFMNQVEAGQSASAQVIVDGTDPNTAGHAITHIVSRTENFSADVLRTSLERRGYPVLSQMMPIDLRLRTWYNPSLKYIIGMVPALIGVVLGMPAISASLAITREKEWGTLEGLIATPIGRLELLVGKLIPYIISGMISVVLCAAVAVFWFSVPFRGSFLTYLVLSADFLLATLSIGLLISILVNSQQAAMIVALLAFLFPGFFLSGILIPLSAMGVMQMEAYMVPTTHYVLINRGIFLKGVGLDALWPWAVALLGIGVVMLILSVLLFKKRLD
ncbi:MAG: putative multidrug ABC transporter permease YbhS [Anaerolineales bacterium]|nr:putative multidrug ABC transporter permease YbhS [Anaerolineales bacterium]